MVESHPFCIEPRIPVEMTGREWGLMGVLAILWGVSFFFSKVALAELPPFTLVLGRFGITALALLLAARLGGHRMPRSPRVWCGFFALDEPVAATAIAGMALVFAGLLAIDGRVLRARRADVAPPRSRSKAA